MVKMTRRQFMRHVAVGSGTVAFLCTGISVHAAGPEAYRLRIIHTNDHHARIEPVTGGTPPAPVHGGVARRKVLIDAIRGAGGNQLLIDAGDVFQGTLWFNQYLGQADLEFYNALGYEAMAIGNHEFDRGQPALADFISRANFPVLSANIQIAAGASAPIAGKFKPWIVKEIGGEKIGIFGLTPPDTTTSSSPGPGITFEDPIAAARRAVGELKAQGVNKIIGLTHVGVIVDRQIAQQVDGIAVIIGGHSHTPMGPMVNPAVPERPYPEVVASPSGKPVIVATDWEWGRWLGDLEIGFDANGDVSSVVAGRPTEVAASITPDAGFDDRVAVLRQPLEAVLKREVGSTTVLLNGKREDVRSKETNLGSLLADAMLAKTRGAGAQIAITNGGGIRSSINPGTITLGDVINVAPFGNTVAYVDLTGAQVKEALENGVSQVETGAGRFPQVAGIRFVWNPAAAAGSRVVAVQVTSGNGLAPLDPTATYRVTSSNFLLSGGDGYSVFRSGKNAYDTGFLQDEVLAEYIGARSPITVDVDGRIAQGEVAVAGSPTTPARLPTTGEAIEMPWLLAALGAGAIGAGLRLRTRAVPAEEVAQAEE